MAAPLSDPALEVLVRAVVKEVMGAGMVQPALFSVKQAAVYLGRSEQSVQHLIFQKELPVVRIRRRVHLDRKDLDAFIERNKDR
jgi:excisionase family DNA binding protein